MHAHDASLLWLIIDGAIFAVGFVPVQILIGRAFSRA